jgi:hypothetical protein
VFFSPKEAMDFARFTLGYGQGFDQDYKLYELCDVRQLGQAINMKEPTPCYEGQSWWAFYGRPEWA